MCGCGIRREYLALEVLHLGTQRSPEDEQARTDLRQALTEGDGDRFRSVSIRYAVSLAQRAVPEWQATLDALQELSELGPDAPIGYGGGVSLGTAIGIPLTAVETRISAAIFGGGFFVYDELIEAARQITVPVQFLLPCDDEHVDRQSALALFDAFASEEKTSARQPGRSPHHPLERRRRRIPGPTPDRPAGQPGPRCVTRGHSPTSSGRTCAASAAVSSGSGPRGIRLIVVHPPSR